MQSNLRHAAAIVTFEGRPPGQRAAAISERAYEQPIAGAQPALLFLVQPGTLNWLAPASALTDSRGFSRCAPGNSPRSRLPAPLSSNLCFKISGNSRESSGTAVATWSDVRHSRESQMVPMLFDALFIISLVVPVVAVCLGAILLLIPRRMNRPAVHRNLPAHA